MFEGMDLIKPSCCCILLVLRLLAYVHLPPSKTNAKSYISHAACMQINEDLVATNERCLEHSSQSKL